VRAILDQDERLADGLSRSVAGAGPG
jgi:hypothetical protein